MSTLIAQRHIEDQCPLPKPDVVRSSKVPNSEALLFQSLSQPSPPCTPVTPRVDNVDQVSSNSRTSNCRPLFTPAKPLPQDSRPDLRTTPVAKESGSQFGFDDAHSPQRYETYDKEFRDYFVGPVDTELFLDFFPESTVSQPSLCRSLSDCLAQVNGREPNLYPVIVCTLCVPSHVL